MSIIHIENLTRDYKDNKGIFDISFDINEGEVFGFLGPNGAGKTTTIRHILGFLKAKEGKVQINGLDVWDNHEKLMENIGYIPGEIAFFDNMTGLEYLKFIHNYRNDKVNHMDELIKMFDLNPKVKIRKMSKGMKRQASFILAFSSKPKVMLLDEPFDGLDPIVRRQIKNIMMQDIANHRLTVLASSHNLREMEDLCDAVSIMHEGHVLISQDLNEVKGSHCKLQIAFKELPSEDFYKDLNVVHKSIKGRIITCILRGDISNVEEKVSKYNPLMYDILPLTLEEIFAYEMGEIGYEIENIIIE